MKKSQLEIWVAPSFLYVINFSRACYCSLLLQRRLNCHSFHLSHWRCFNPPPAVELTSLLSILHPTDDDRSEEDKHESAEPSRKQPRII
jgi:hypothetical protein